MVQPYWNMCVPLRPMLGAITLTKAETIPREKKQRQPKTKDAQVGFVASKSNMYWTLTNMCWLCTSMPLFNRLHHSSQGHWGLMTLQKKIKTPKWQNMLNLSWTAWRKSTSGVTSNPFHSTISLLIPNHFQIPLRIYFMLASLLKMDLLLFKRVILHSTWLFCLCSTYWSKQYSLTDPENRLPTLQVTKKTRNMNEQNESMTPAFGAKRQLVVSLDQGTWKVLECCSYSSCKRILIFISI